MTQLIIWNVVATNLVTPISIIVFSKVTDGSYPEASKSRLFINNLIL